MSVAERMIVEKMKMKDLIADLYDQNQQLKAQNQTMEGRLERLENDVAMKSATSDGAQDVSEGFKTAGSGSNRAAVEESSHLIGSGSIDEADGGVRFSSSASMGVEPLGRYLSGRERNCVDYQEGLQRGLRMACSEGSGTRFRVACVSQGSRLA